jgi:putative phosphoserine phosphatase/1-acylglycerol-3-phosphate O-acyltransferase
LTAQRPAVFIFNHRNQADPMIAGTLVNDNFTSVGKKELENDPIVGTMGKIMDAAFIDRDDPKKAVEGLKKVEELARKGLSILIAPEGTRLDTTEVGEFKKGPFRIAMSAGIPIVPIVIRNAEVIAARDSSTFNPGTVDVVVYPPIPIDDWTHDNLPERIAEVRQLYLDTLKDWPHDVLPTPDLYKCKKAPAKKAAANRAAKKAVKNAAAKAPAKKTPAKKAPTKAATTATTKAAEKKPAKKTPAKNTTKRAAAKGRP